MCVLARDLLVVKGLSWRGIEFSKSGFISRLRKNRRWKTGETAGIIEKLSYHRFRETTLPHGASPNKTLTHAHSYTPSRILKAREITSEGDNAILFLEEDLGGGRSAHGPPGTLPHAGVGIVSGPSRSAGTHSLLSVFNGVLSIQLCF